MKRLMTAAIVAALCASLPARGQEVQDLERLVDKAIDAPAADDAPLYDDAKLDLIEDDEIDALVAPFALYPDALLAQVLVASTFPLQIVHADRILDDSAEMSDDEVTEAIDARDWDPSVLVLLTGFPEVIQRMADDLDDTERLGLAMAQQDRDVLDSVQRLREQAEATGWLVDNEAQTVARVDDRIVIEPTEPDVVYVPRYDESRAFVSPATQSPVILQPGAQQQGFNPLLAGAIGFGSALLVNEMFGDEDKDNDKNGWDDYWRKDRRAIDWRDRQLYPRAEYWDDPDRRRAAAWSRERDRFWDRGEKRWRAEQADERRARRQDADWIVRRDANGKAEVKLKDWSDVRAAIERHENRLDRSEQALEADRRRDAAAAREADRRRRAEQEIDERRDRAREDRQEQEQAVEARRERAAAEERKAAERERAEDRAAAREKAEADRKRQARREAVDAKEQQAAAARAEAEAERQRRARRETIQDKERQAAAREKAEAEREAARVEAEAGERAAVRKARAAAEVERARQAAAAERERRAERVRAEAADDRRQKQAAAEKRGAERQAVAARQREQAQEAKTRAQEQEAKPQAKREPASAEKPQRSSESKEPQPKNRKKRCPDGQGENCVPNN